MVFYFKFILITLMYIIYYRVNVISDTINEDYYTLKGVNVICLAQCNNNMP